MTYGKWMIATVVVLAVLIGPSCLPAMTPGILDTPTAEAYSVKSRENIDGWAIGAKWRCAGKFNHRGKRIGIYCHAVPITNCYKYTLYGKTYYGVTYNFGDDRFKGWYVRSGPGTGKGGWLDSTVYRQ